MSTLRLKNLEIEGFRSFKEKQTIVFPEESGAILIKGTYIDSDVSSGSGKSSIPIAIAFALGICSLPATELKNWDSKTLMVKLVLTDLENTYEIIRNPKLKLKINGIEFSGKTADEKLQELLGVNQDLLKSLTYREQRTQSSFIESTDAQNKEFLSAILDLNEIEQAADKLSEDLKATKNEKEKIQFSLQTLSASIKQEWPSEWDLDTAKTALENAQKEYDLAQDSSGKMSELLHLNTTVQSQINSLEITIRKGSQAAYENEQLKNKALLLKKEAETLAASICPTCKREWDNGQQLLEIKNKEIKEISAKFIQNNGFIKESANAQAELPYAKKRYQDITNEIAALKAPAASASAMLSSAKLSLDSIIKQLDYKKKIESQILELTHKSNTLDSEVVVLEQAVELVGRNGFLSVIFDQVLAEIETKTNEMLSELPNLSTFTLKLDSESVTKSGITKKTISKSVFKNGEAVSIKSLSGGQLCGLVLCTELAISETVKSRSGSRLNWLILDESLDGLDNTTKQNALNLIKTRTSGTIIIIDHSTEIKEGFQQVINVSFDGRYSSIEQQG